MSLIAALIMATDAFDTVILSFNLRVPHGLPWLVPEEGHRICESGSF
jgi:hypothetical protein